MARKAVPVILVFIALPVLVSLSAGAQSSPTVEDVRAFLERAEARLNELAVRSARASWVQSTYITVDTQQIAAEASEALIAATTELANEAAGFRDVRLPPDLTRKLMLLRLSLTLPAPADPDERAELTRIASALEADYGRGRYCRGQVVGQGFSPADRGQVVGQGFSPADGGQVVGQGFSPADEGRREAPDKGACLTLREIEELFAESRDPKELLDLWVGWRTIAPPMRQPFERLVALTNEGARELGFPDTGAMWRSNWDMPPDEFSREVERLWEQVRPFYQSLHAYVRRRLSEHYGPALVPREGPIPAHLLGNVWAQQWANIYPLVEPRGAAGTVDLTARLRAKNIDARGMVRMGERFFTSLGLRTLPQTFWERSLFVQPEDRDVVCHASAWTLDNREDVRLKMCIQVRDEDFRVVHHELGHTYYQLAYNEQPYLFQNSANAAFHEAIGDTVALSITPEYLARIGLIEKVPPASGDIGLLLHQALDKVAFLPFGVLIDQWRWRVFSGDIGSADYNKTWWQLRTRYQGVAPPVERTEQQFDPGAKYHVPASYPYTSYFLAHVLQFQFHRSLCEAAGQKGPLHRCSIYDSREAGARLRQTLEMGASRPWPEAMEALTGHRQMDAGALLDYFAPLRTWLDEQNKGERVEW
jgi:peptidyl-dipeptidase A